MSPGCCCFQPLFMEPHLESYQSDQRVCHLTQSEFCHLDGSPDFFPELHQTNREQVAKKDHRLVFDQFFIPLCSVALNSRFLCTLFQARTNQPH